MLADHPELAGSRGQVAFWNFLPPAELDRLLGLFAKVTGKVLVISKTLGIEGRKLLTPDDDYDPLKDFNQDYLGERSVVEDMQLEYQGLLADHPGLEQRLRRLPGAVFSGREHLPEGSRGVFFCYALPALDKKKAEFTLEAGVARWYLYDANRDAIVEEPGDIVASIRSAPDTPRVCSGENKLLLEIRTRVERHIKQTYLKRVDAPVGAEPVLRCWLELA
jgi:hypothetical protein